MKKIFLLSLLLVIFSCNNSVKKDNNSSSEEKSVTTNTTNDDVETTYYLIRHAEKDRSDPNNTDPGLTEEGLERAKYWATYFSDKNIHQIYSTDYNRTQLTAYFVSVDYYLGVQNYVPGELFTEDFKLVTKGEVVLIVGHSNTIPRLVNNMIGENKYPDIDDNDNSSLYIVKIKGDTITSEVTKVEIQ